jgi:bacteriocin biosynthesis cyclodehydratase domain-containing protein
MVGRSKASSQDRRKKPHPLSGLISLSGSDARRVSGQLAASRIAIFGLEGHGADLAVLLAQCGVGSLTLADPFPCLRENLTLSLIYRPVDVGKSRQVGVARRIKASRAGTSISDIGRQEVTAALVDAVVESVDLVVSCFDRGFRSVDYWINRAALKHGRAALFSELSSATATAGPLVLPGRSACYMCYRMRELACAPNLSLALAREQLLDAERNPQLHQREVIPALSQSVASTLCMEIVKHLLHLPGRSLTGAILSINPIDLQTVLHPVLQQPKCSDCIDRGRRLNGGADGRSPGPVEQLRSILCMADQLVSRRVGLVKELRLIEKDYHDPALPLVAQAVLANSSFDDGIENPRTATSGKGATLGEAHASALGEAIESYCGEMWSSQAITWGTRGEIRGITLDPRELVLFRDDQYPVLPYSRYTDGLRLGWIQARSLLTEQPVQVPAISILPVIRSDAGELLFQPTSCGSGAGVSQTEAHLRAVLEIIERDAFAIAWLNRLPGRRVDPTTHPDPAVRGYCAAIARREGAIYLIALPTDSLANVFLAVALGGEQKIPAAAIGLGAGLDAVAAARSAIWEAEQVRVILTAQLRDERHLQRLMLLNDAPEEAVMPDDHSLLYSHPSQTAKLGFLLNSPTQDFDWGADAERQMDQRSPETILGTLLDDFRAREFDVLALDITAEDIAGLGLHATRVLVPGYQPIHFGSEARLGGRRLYNLPIQLGLRKKPIATERLNLYPHPLG